MLKLEADSSSTESEKSAQQEPLNGIEVDGRPLTLFSSESAEAFHTFEQEIENDRISGNTKTLYRKGRQLFAMLLNQDITPVFSVPRKYIDKVLKNGLIPHETDIKGVALLAGTFGIPPYSRGENDRYLVVLKNPQKALQYHLQPRFTGTHNIWSGVVATRTSIPLEELVIIDSANNEVVYDGGSRVNILYESNVARENIIDIQKHTQAEATLHFDTDIHVEKDQLDRLFKNGYSPQKLMDAFYQDFSKEFETRVTSWDKETLRGHTLKVLSQFEKFYAQKDLPMGFDKNLFRIVLLFHDIGKPLSFKDGDVSLHHEYSSAMLRNVLEKLGYDKTQIKLAQSLIKKDSIGMLLKKKDVETCATNIMQLANGLNVDPDEFIDLLKIFYLSDASSYTKNAGGIANMDDLFDFYKDGDGNPAIDFADDPADLVYLVEDRIRQMRKINYRAA